MSVVIEAAHQARVSLPGYICRVQTGGHCSEEILSFSRKIIVDGQRGVRDWTVFGVFAIEDAQRIAPQSVDAVFRQVGPMVVEIINQCRTPSVAARRIAQRIELQRHTVIDAEFFEQLIRHHQQFDIGRRFRRTDNLCIDLVELPIAALLRAFISKQWPVHRQLHRRILLPAIGQIRPSNACGKFGSKRNRIATTVVERVHFFRHDIGRLAKAPREYGSRLDHRHLQALEAIKPPHAFKGRDDMRKAFFGFAEHILGAANGLRGGVFCHCRCPSGNFGEVECLKSSQEARKH